MPSWHAHPTICARHRLTAGLRGAPFGCLAFGNPLGGHGGCGEAEAQPPVPASQVRKPACRYTQWPFWGRVLEGRGSRGKTRTNLVVPAGNGGSHSRSPEEKQFIPTGLQDRNLPVKSLLARKADQTPPDATPKAAFLLRSCISDIRILPPDPTPIHPDTMCVHKVRGKTKPEDGGLMISLK